MLSPDDIANQQKLLAIYRNNLAHLLQQAARYGGEHAAPLDVMNNIADVRANIQQIKDVLRSANVAVEDRPDDTAPTPRILARPHAPQSPSSQSAGIRRYWWLLLILIVISGFGVFLRGYPRSTSALVPDVLPTSLVANQSSASNQPRATHASGTAPSPNAGVLPAPTFPTPQPILPPAQALNITNTPGRSENAQIAVDAAGNVHVVWLDNTPRQGKGETVLHRKMTPEGTWSDVEDLTPTLEYVGNPYLVANLDRKVCLVIDSVAGIFTRCLENNSWSPLANPVKLGTRNVFAPALGADGQPRWIAGLNSATFEGVQLDDGLAGVTDAEFVIDANGGYHAVWRRVGNPYSIEHRFSNDEGKTWQPQQRLTTTDAEFAENPMLVADTLGAVHLVWDEESNMLYRRWTPTDGWGDTVQFADGKAFLTGGIAADAQGHIAVVWARDCNIFYARQSADGSWSQARVLNENASPSACGEQPRIAIDEPGRQHILWIAPGADGERDVFYAQLPNTE